VWFDAEGSPGAAIALVNDLDLTISQDMSTFRGNVSTAPGVDQRPNRRAQHQSR
jgi:hypothetical protein